MPRELLPELISDILLRLPAKSLLRFRCLSNSLRDEINSPNFVQIHLKKSSETRSHRNLIFINSKGLYAFDFNEELMNAHEFNYQFTYPGQYTLEMIHTCHGLILLHAWKKHPREDLILLLNPATRQLKLLPPCPYDVPECLFPSYGLGYDYGADDYKVFNVSTHQDLDLQHFCVFSLKSNSWRQCQDLHLTNELISYPLGFANGFLYLIYFGDSGLEKIGCFDVANEVFITLSSLFSPNDGGELGWYGMDSSINMKLEITEEVFLLHKYNEESNVDEFYPSMVNEINAGGNWRKTFTFKREQTPGVYERAVVPLAYSKVGAYVLLQTDTDIFWYNMETKTRLELKCSREISKSNSLGCAVIGESLVSLGNDGVFQIPHASSQTTTRRTRTSNAPVSTAKRPRTEIRTRSKGIRIEESSCGNSTVTKPITRADTAKANGHKKVSGEGKTSGKGKAPWK